MKAGHATVTMAAMPRLDPRSRRSSVLVVALVGAGTFAPTPSRAAPGPDASTEAPAVPAPDVTPDESAPPDGPVEGPTAPEPEPDRSESEPPPPTLDPPEKSGIEFAIPPPDTDDEPAPDEERPIAAMTFPDPGSAPNDGASMLVLGGTTIGLTAAGFAAGLVVGLQNQVPLDWLLPSTIVPTVGFLAFAGGGLYLGIQRARKHRRWEIGNRVIGLPQGAGLQVGASFMLLASLSLIPAGAFALSNGETTLGATMIGIGSATAVATPIMFVIGGRRARVVARTGGWRRKPIPPLPSEAGRLQISPMVTPMPSGLSIGAVGRF